jgi:hypothetical protein
MPIFIHMQAIGWTLFALTAAYIGALAKLLVTGVMVCLRCWLLGASVLMIATQLVSKGPIRQLVCLWVSGTVSCMPALAWHAMRWPFLGTPAAFAPVLTVAVCWREALHHYQVWAC